GLILISTEAHAPTQQELTTSRRFLDHWHEPRIRPQLAEHLAQWLIGQDPHSRAIWAGRWRTHEPHALEVAAGCLLSRDSVLDRLAEITCPALVIHPAGAGIPRAHARQMADRLPDSRFLEIENARQAVNLTHPEQINAAIREFLRERVPTRTP
ncbi:MAG: alpha/beta hydrolase, partial [Nocardia sp.]|nr:alpha/beta hydrolase [Nocardia sp.]